MNSGKKTSLSHASSGYDKETDGVPERFRDQQPTLAAPFQAGPLVKENRQDRQLVAVRIESYEGADTFLRCGDDEQDYLFAVVSIDAQGKADIVDSSYRTIDEVYEAWPEAQPRSLS